MRFYRINTLQWAIGSMCAIFGALMLVAPHQYSAPDYASIQANAFFWGIVFLFAGGAILTTVVFPLPQALRGAVFLTGAGLLAFLAYGFAATRFWIWFINYAVMAVALLASLFLPSANRSNESARSAIDVFALTIGALAILSGLFFILAPGAFPDRRYDLVRPYLWLVGTLLAAAGGWLLWAQRAPADQVMPRLPAYWFAGLILLAYMIVVPGINHLWTGVVVYGGLSAALFIVPFIRIGPHSFHPSYLRTRLALLLIATMAIPLIITVALVSSQEEASVVDEVLDRQRGMAQMTAQRIGEFVRLHRATLAVLANEPGLLEQSPEEIRQRLQLYAQKYPDVTAFSVYDAQGKAIARSDNARLTDATGFPVYEQALQTGQPSQDILISPLFGRPIFAFGAPILDAGGHLSGLAVLVIDSSRVTSFLNTLQGSTGARVYLVDEHGRAIAHPDSNLVASFANISATPAVSAFLQHPNAPDTLDTRPHGSAVLAGYAPVDGLKWGVIIEVDAPLALESVYSGRDLAFGILLACLMLAAAAGMVLASWVSNPLNALGDAARQIASGENPQRLPHSRITEIQTLADIFAEMRDRLIERTAERERAQAALREANERLEEKVAERTLALEKANRELQDFAYIASHDMQEPLRKIQAFGERLAKRMESQLDPDSADYLERMRNAAERMQAMINALLSYSRITTKAQPLEPVDLNAVVAEVLSDLEVRIEQTGGQVQVKPLPTILADRMQMQQLFQNLISNALKFHQKDAPPQVCISAQAVASRSPGEERVQIQVEDHGIGFDEKYLSRLFQPFQRLFGRSEYEGNGIGLAICRKIVERHQGSITARSTPGEGTTFLVELPADLEKQVMPGETK